MKRMTTHHRAAAPGRDRPPRRAAQAPAAFAPPAVALPLAAALAALLGGCGGGGGSSADLNLRPAFVRGEIATRDYDGAADDLLTAGVGAAGLRAGAAVPAPADAANPSAVELRRLAIVNNYRALVDVTPAGGFGTLYGPNVGPGASADGKVAGTEYLAYSDDGSGRENVTMLVQVPARFDAANPCIVLAASSGSRGVYGAIGTAGEWGLKRGCAVAYTDKGTGVGLHDLSNGTVTLRDGTRATAASAVALTTATASAPNFVAPTAETFGPALPGVAVPTAQQLREYAAANPGRFAVKHAHSQRNSERDWGRHGLQAVELAFYVLNERFGEPRGAASRTRRIVPANTIVIASSASNGAAVSIAAAEQDAADLIDGVAVSEPQIQLPPNGAVAVRRGASTLAGAGRTLLDYTTLANLLQPCAALATPGAPSQAAVVAARAANRCATLAARGQVTGATTAQQAADALARLRQAGWEAEADPLHASHYLFAVPAVATTYANAYGRFSVVEELCGFSFAATDANAASPTFGRPVAAAPAAIAQSFGTGNGIPPMSTINIVNENAVGGPLVDPASVSPSTQQPDYNLDGALCLRGLLDSPEASGQRVRQGASEVLRSGNLRGKPAIIVHGRSDALVPPAFSSRPYAAVNRAIEGAGSRLSYVEVTNAQHFDAFITALPGYDTRYVPLHFYFNQAMDAMWAHLKSGAALPPSQVVRTTPRGGAPGAAPAITAANVPPIAATPAAGSQVTFQGGTLVVPD